MSHDRDDVFAEPPHVTPQQQEYAIQRRLEVAQRLADSIRRISNEAEVFGGGFGEWIRDQAANALAEWESTK